MILCLKEKMDCKPQSVDKPPHTDNAWTLHNWCGTVGRISDEGQTLQSSLCVCLPTYASAQPEIKGVIIVLALNFTVQQPSIDTMFSIFSLPERSSSCFCRKQHITKLLHIYSALCIIHNLSHRP